MKNAARSGDSGAPPDRTNFTRPPRRPRIFLNTSLSAIADRIFSPAGISLFSTRYGSRSSAIFNAHAKIFCFTAEPVATVSRIRERIFSKRRGTAAKTSGFTSCKFSPTLSTLSAYAMVAPR